MSRAWAIRLGVGGIGLAILGALWTPLPPWSPTAVADQPGPAVGRGPQSPSNSPPVGRLRPERQAVDTGHASSVTPPAHRPQPARLANQPPAADAETLIVVPPVLTGFNDLDPPRKVGEPLDPDDPEAGSRSAALPEQVEIGEPLDPNGPEADRLSAELAEQAAIGEALDPNAMEAAELPAAVPTPVEIGEPRDPDAPTPAPASAAAKAPG